MEGNQCAECVKCANCQFDPIEWGRAVQRLDHLEKDRDHLLNELDEQSKCMAKIKIGQAVDRLKVAFISAVLILMLTQALPWVVQRLGG